MQTPARRSSRARRAGASSRTASPRSQPRARPAPAPAGPATRTTLRTRSRRTSRTRSSGSGTPSPTAPCNRSASAATKARRRARPARGGKRPSRMTPSTARAPPTPTSEAALPRLEPQRHAVVEGDLLAGLDRPQRDEIEGERREVADERAVRRRGVVDEARVAERDRGPALLAIEVLADRAGLLQKDVVSDVRRIDGAALFMRDDQHRRTLDERALLDPAVGDDAAPAPLEFHDPQLRPLPAQHREIARPAA